MQIKLIVAITVLLLWSCNPLQDNAAYHHDSIVVAKPDTMGLLPTQPDDSIQITDVPVLAGKPMYVPATIDTKSIPPDSIVAFAKTLLGVPYQYASTDPNVGFDCSGFITYVFNHFNISVPRSSIDFTNVGKEIPLQQARKGQLILFTGTDSTIDVVGHMGIVVDNSDSLRFIHSSSGRANGVTITPLTNYYKGRFVKVIDIY